MCFLTNQKLLVWTDQATHCLHCESLGSGKDAQCDQCWTNWNDGWYHEPAGEENNSRTWIYWLLYSEILSGSWMSIVSLSLDFYLFFVKCDCFCLFIIQPFPDLPFLTQIIWCVCVEGSGPVQSSVLALVAPVSCVFNYACDLYSVFWGDRMRKLCSSQITELDPQGVHSRKDDVPWPHFLYSLCTSCLPALCSLMPSFIPCLDSIDFFCLWGRFWMANLTRAAGMKVSVVPFERKWSHSATVRKQHQARMRREGVQAQFS